jgi:hypothetical protein
MTISINYTSKIEHRNTLLSKFGGSSRFRLEDGELIEKVIRKEAPKKNQFEKMYEKEKPILEEGITEDEKKTYRLNKSKVKRKCHAFSRLEKSQVFLAFYTISFPLNLSDQICYKIFNTWLTRCRNKSGLKSYLWVAERQKNGTIHFHLLTNDFMKIKLVNGFMASALKTEKKKGNEVLKEVDVEIYNGVDVKRVGNKKKGLITYLVKYISKNDIRFYRLPWHCSRDVSRLFTSINLDESDEEKILALLPDDKQKYTETYEMEFVKVTGFKFTPKDEVFSDLDMMNEMIYTNN